MFQHEFDEGGIELLDLIITEVDGRDTTFCLQPFRSSEDHLAMEPLEFFLMAKVKQRINMARVSVTRESVIMLH